MTKNTFVTCISLCLVVLFLQFCGTTRPIPPAVHCDDTRRYTSTDVTGGGQELSLKEAQALVDAFQRTHGTSGTVPKGAFISKRALDQLFDASNTANGLNCYFAKKSDGTWALVFEAVATTKNRLTTGAGSNIFVSETYCPPTCGAIR